MKKTILFAVVASLVFSYSCKKKDTVVSNLDLLQHKWTDDSLVVYDNQNFTGTGYKTPNFQGYSDFRTDGKLYSFSSSTSNGVTESSFDTSLYTLKDNLIITFAINNGIASANGDTAKINTITDKSLVASSVSKDVDGTYSKLYLHR